MTEATFNAVIEGMYKDVSGEKAGFKLARLDIPDNTPCLSDGMHRFVKFTSGQQQKNGVTEQSNLETVIESLTSCRGVIIPKKTGEVNVVMDKPRMIYMRDGRVFLEEKTFLENDSYKRTLKDHVQGLNIIFKEVSFNHVYTQAMRELAQTQTQTP